MIYFAVGKKFNATINMCIIYSLTAQIWVLRSVFELWHSHPQMMAVLIDKMLRTQIVTCAAVANWIFIPSMKVRQMLGVVDCSLVYEKRIILT